MPNEHPEIAAGHLNVLRQIVFTLPKTQAFVESQRALFKRLKEVGIGYIPLVHVPEARLQAIEVSPGEDVERICRNFVADGFAEAAEQNRFLRPAQVVDDPLYHQQWALLRIGAEPAWSHAMSVLNPAAHGVKVAIVDTGLQTRHPDLAGHLWNGPGGPHGENIFDGGFDVSDADGHGTQLAGIIGAVSNNTIGIAAAQWPVRLMAIKFLDVNHPPTALSGALGILAAIRLKAQIICLAWGVGIAFTCLQVAIQLAAAAHIVVVAAAGNDGLDNDHLPTYPASYRDGAPDFCPTLISVMASDRYDDKAWFSNYGQARVHLGAPGISVLTTDTYFATPRWKAFSGTSASCAYVTYAAALLRAMQPGWTATEIRDHLVASVDKSPWLKCIAQGRLSLERAIRGPFTITSPVEGDLWAAGTPAQIKWTNSYVTGRPTTTVKIEISTGGMHTLLAPPGTPNTGACTVMAPGATPGARLRIQSDQGPGLFADSGTFKVV
jgi:subtilisin family serine protease